MSIKPMVFDITGAAPNSAQLAAQAKLLEMSYDKKKRAISAVNRCFCVALFSLFASAAGLAITNGLATNTVRTDSICGAWIFCSIGVLIASATVSDRWGARLFDLAFSLSTLDIIDRRRCPEVLAWCEAHPVVAAYQRHVAQQERFLVNGEAAAIEAYVRSLKEREVAAVDERRQREACMRLKTAVASAA